MNPACSRRDSKGRFFLGQSETRCGWEYIGEAMNTLAAKSLGKEAEPKVPADLRKALAAAAASKAKWDDLTPIARRDFISWIEAAKQPETRRRRVERACDMLVTGKRRPCCFSIVPLDLHLALKAMPKAKTQWSGLASTARRDFIDWIESAKQRETRRDRIDKTCAMLAAGKRRP
jgi:uncharacterized protein YdeI (YjbR/CyaY-like superfamily)